jgi:ubiquinone/menaquinone biosynthesis C-methylase UbiE
MVCRTQLFEVKTLSAYNPTAADVYGSAEVEGTDVNAIVLSKDTTVKFIQDDAEENWLFKGNSLDFVRASLLLNSIKDRPRLFGQTWQ